MNKNAQTYYAIMSVEERLPDEEGYYRTEGEVWAAYWHNDKKEWDKKPEVTHWLSEHRGVVLSVEEWEKVKVKDDIIRSLEQQIQQANEKLDQIGAPSVSAYGNQLTILGRLDGCVYIGPTLQSNKQL